MALLEHEDVVVAAFPQWNKQSFQAVLMASEKKMIKEQSTQNRSNLGIES